MNNEIERLIADNTAIDGYLGNRPFFEEGKVNQGKSGFGRLARGDVTSWAKGVSKPFGTANKPKRPNEDKRLESVEFGSKTVRMLPGEPVLALWPSLDFPLYGPKCPPMRVFLADGIGKFDKDEHDAKVARSLIAGAIWAEEFARKAKRKIRRKGKEMEGPVIPKVRKGPSSRGSREVGKKGSGKFVAEKPLPKSGCLTEAQLVELRQKLAGREVPRE